MTGEKWKKQMKQFGNNPLSNVLKIIATKHTGTEKELKTALTGLLYILRVLARRDRSGILKVVGSSSAGKTNLVNTLLQCFPPSWVKTLGSISANALKYIQWQDEKILYIQEAGGADDTTEHLKLMDSGDGGFKAAVTVRGENGEFVTKEYEIPVKFIITTRAEGMFDSQLENRMFALSIDESDEQTFLVLIHRCKDFAGHNIESDFENIQNYLTSLSEFDEIRVPYSYEFLNILERKKMRVRRDIDKILSLCQTSAFLNQWNRPIIEKNGKKTLYATPEDAYNVFVLSFPSFEETITGLPKKYQIVYDAIPEVDSTTYRDIAKKIGWNKRSVTRAIQDQLDNLGIVNIDSTSNVHKISRADELDKATKDFQEFKLNFLAYTGIELCLHNKKCDIPIAWNDIDNIIKCDTNRDKLGQKITSLHKNCDKDRDKSVTNFYEIDELNSFFKSKDQYSDIIISHPCHGFVTLTVTLSSPYEMVSFKYCDTVTKGDKNKEFEPDIKLEFPLPLSHGVTPPKKDIQTFLDKFNKPLDQDFFNEYYSQHLGKSEDAIVSGLVVCGVSDYISKDEIREHVKKAIGDSNET